MKSSQGLLKSSQYFSQTKCENTFDINLEKIASSDPIQEIINIIFENTTSCDGIFALHAGAVSYRGKAIIFVAPTMKGKTTLVSYLIHNGFDYVTDDCVLIDKNEMIVYPFPKPIHLRSGGYEILKKSNLKIENVKSLEAKSSIKYVFTPQKIANGKLEIEQIIFIEFNETSNEITMLNSAQIIQQLMKLKQ